MQTDEYIKTYMLSDIVLAIVLVVTAYTWYLLLNGKDKDQNAEQQAIAEVVIPADSTTIDSGS